MNKKIIIELLLISVLGCGIFYMYITLPTTNTTSDTGVEPSSETTHHATTTHTDTASQKPATTTTSTKNRSTLEAQTANKSASEKIEITDSQKIAIKDSAAKAIVMGIRAEAEKVYFNDFENPSYQTLCQSKAIKESSAYGLICRSTKTDYIAYQKLSSGNYYCADSVGNFLELTSEPKELTCK